MIPFYVQARKIAIQTIFGDASADRNISLEHLYVSADKLAVICFRIFERFIPDRSLSTSAGNVIKSLNPLSFNSTDEISVLDFMHFCLVEYQRLQLKAFHDEEVMQRQRKRKVDDIKVPPIDQMFYRDPSIIIKNFDYENAQYIPVAQYQTNRTVNTAYGDIDESLLRIAAPTSKYQNNPPMTVEEKRKLREKPDDDEALIKTVVPQKPKHISSKTIKKGDHELNDRDIDAQAANDDKSIIGGGKSRVNANVFTKDGKLDTSAQQNSALGPAKTTGSRGKIRNQESAKLMPARGANLGVPGVFINNSDAGHTSSHRSLYSYGSRNNDIISVPQTETKPQAQPKQPVESYNADEFSGLLSSAAINKPSFLDKTKKHKHADSNHENYENSHSNRASVPELPPRNSEHRGELETK